MLCNSEHAWLFFADQGSAICLQHVLQNLTASCRSNQQTSSRCWPCKISPRKRAAQGQKATHHSPAQHWACDSCVVWERCLCRRLPQNAPQCGSTRSAARHEKAAALRLACSRMASARCLSTRLSLRMSVLCRLRFSVGAHQLPSITCVCWCAAARNAPELVLYLAALHLHTSHTPSHLQWRPSTGLGYA